MNWKILPAVAVSVLLFASTALACWEGPPPKQYVRLAARYFNVGQLEYDYALQQKGLSHEESAVYSDKRQAETMQSWPGLIETDINDATAMLDLTNLVYHLNKSELDGLVKGFEQKKLEGSLVQNKAAQQLVKSQDKAVLDYLIFMYDINNSMLNWRYWRYNEMAGSWNEEARQKAVATALTGYQANANPNLQMRYAFQYIRILHNLGLYETAVAFYESEIKNKPDTDMKLWCRAFYGGCLDAVNDYAGAFRELAVVYHLSDRYSEMVEGTLKDSRFKDVVGDAVLRAESAEEVAFVRSAGGILQGEFKDCLLQMTEMNRKGYKPPPADLEGSILRIINGSSTCNYGAEDEALVAGIGGPVPSYWQLAAAHLAIKRKDFDAAQKYIDMAAMYGAETDLPIQLRITRLLWQIHALPLTTENEERIGQMLVELESMYVTWNKPVVADAYYTEKNKNAAGRELEPIGGFLSRREEIYYIEIKNMEKPYAYRIGLSLYNSLRGLLETELTQRYLAAGRNDRAFFCLAIINQRFGDYPYNRRPRGEFYATYTSFSLYESRKDFSIIMSDPAALKEVIRIFNRPVGALETYFATADLPGFSDDVMHEMLGLAYLQRHEFSAAADAFAGISGIHDWPWQFGIKSYFHALPDSYFGKGTAAIRNCNIRIITAIDSMKTWEEQRFADKTPNNPLRESHQTIFGHTWEDDFASLIVMAKKDGVSLHYINTLEQVLAAPKTFWEFAKKMEQLFELSQAEDEAGAIACYFYALALYNMHCKTGWHHRSYYEKMPADDLHYIVLQFERAIAKSQNDELKARAVFMIAGLSKALLGYKIYEDPMTLRWEKTLAYDKDLTPYFLKYAAELAVYNDTVFAREIEFHCPQAVRFLRGAIPLSDF